MRARATAFAAIMYYAIMRYVFMWIDRESKITLRAGYFPHRTRPDDPNAVYFGIEVKNGTLAGTVTVMSVWLMDRYGFVMDHRPRVERGPFVLRPGDSIVEHIIIPIVGPTRAPRLVRPCVYLSDGRTVKGKIHHIPKKAWL